MKYHKLKQFIKVHYKEVVSWDEFLEESKHLFGLDIKYNLKCIEEDLKKHIWLLKKGSPDPEDCFWYRDMVEINLGLNYLQEVLDRIDGQ